MNKLLLLSLLPLSAQSMETYLINPDCVQASHKLGSFDLLKSGPLFEVSTPGQKVQIPVWNTDKKLIGVTPAQLSAFLAGGYLKVGKLSDGEYKIEARVRGEGGGPLFANIAYGITKATCWTAVVLCGIGAAGKLSRQTGETGEALTTGMAGRTAAELAKKSGNTLPVGTTPTIVGTGLGKVAHQKLGPDGIAYVATTAYAGGSGLVGAIEGISLAVAGWVMTWPTP